MTRDGKPYLALGSMGGEGRPQTQAALVTRIVDFGYDVQQASEAPRWLMVPTRVIKLSQLYAIDWNTCVLAGALIPLATATPFLIAVALGAAHLTPMSTPVNIVTYGPGA